MTRRIAIDIETSGLDPESGAEIIMVCALEVLDGMQSGAAFQKLTRPNRPLARVAEHLTGISNSALERSPRFTDIVDDFVEFIANAELVCLDWEFDSSFLNLALANSGRPSLQPERVVDLWEKVPIEFREQGSDGIYSYAAIEPNPLAAPSEEVSRLYWALVDR
jgi:DNA polymerase-3 subunit epsilon